MIELQRILRQTPSDSRRITAEANLWAWISNLIPIGCWVRSRGLIEYVPQCPGCIMDCQNKSSSMRWSCLCQAGWLEKSSYKMTGSFGTRSPSAPQALTGFNTEYWNWQLAVNAKCKSKWADLMHFDHYVNLAFNEVEIGRCGTNTPLKWSAQLGGCVWSHGSPIGRYPSRSVSDPADALPS